MLSGGRNTHTSQGLWPSDYKSSDLTVWPSISTNKSWLQKPFYSNYGFKLPGKTLVHIHFHSCRKKSCLSLSEEYFKYRHMWMFCLAKCSPFDWNVISAVLALLNFADAGHRIIFKRCKFLGTIIIWHITNLIFMWLVQ